MKMMKNLLSCFVAAAMLAAAVPAVAFAADNAALEQAIVSVKIKFKFQMNIQNLKAVSTPKTAKAAMS